MWFGIEKNKWETISLREVVGIKTSINISEFSS